MAEDLAKERMIYLPDGRPGGSALVDMEMNEGGWTLAFFDRSLWLGRDEDDEPYTADNGTFLIHGDGIRFSVHQTVATMLEN